MDLMKSAIAYWRISVRNQGRREVESVRTLFFLSLASLPWPARSQFLRVVDGAEFHVKVSVRIDWDGSVSVPHEVQIAEAASSSHVVAPPHSVQLTAISWGIRENGGTIPIPQQRTLLKKIINLST